MPVVGVEQAADVVAPDHAELFWEAEWDAKGVTINAEGHYRGSQAGNSSRGLSVEKQIVYVVQTNDSQQTLTPQEFARKYKRQNDPSWVRLLP